MKNSRYTHVYDGTIGFDQRQGKIPGFKKYILSLQPQNGQNISKNTKKHFRQTKPFLEAGTKQKHYFQMTASLVQTKQLFNDLNEIVPNTFYGKYKKRTQNTRQQCVKLF